MGSSARGFKGSLQRFALSFTPSRFRAYWLNRQGLFRLAKFGGAGLLFVVLVFLWYAKDLPSPSKINSSIGLTTTFYARDELDNPGHGTKLYEVHGDQNRLLINFNQMPTSLKQATIAIEDKNFYKEGAFSITGMARAFTGVITGNSAAGGGSTITQQYVKNSLLTNERSYSRKIKELILSIEIGQFYSKDDILKLYLNEIPYGNGSYGIEAACRTYFSDAYGKVNCAQHLNVSQSALLAAIPNAPSYYNPYGQHKQELIDRQHTILDKMVEQGYIKQADADGAKLTLAQLDTSTPSTLAINKTPTFYSSTTAPNFVYTVQDQLEQKYGTSAVEQGGWKVITTLDPNLQSCAELAVYNPGNATCKPDGKTVTNPNINNANYKNLTASKGSNAAIVASDPKSGQVLAMVGSYNFPESQINMATTPRQPGSSFKPYVYATLFSKNKDANCVSNTASCATYGSGSILNDTITEGDSFGDYKPRDFGGSAEVGGPVTIRTALGGSLNIPAVQALQLAGVSQSIDQATSMGITTLDKPASTYGLSLVLGSAEVSLADHVNAYESFANGGVHYDPTMILKITDSKNNVMEDNTKPKTPKRVLDAQVAYMLANMMSDATSRAFVFGSELNIPGHTGSGTAGQGVAVKTGTTEHYNDAWTMGYTPSIVAGVWAGNNDNSPMTNQAADIAAPIWRGFMTAALLNKPMETFVKPAGLQYLPIAGSAARSTSSYDFYPKWYKQISRKMIKLDKVSQKLATDCTPPLAIESVIDDGTTATDDFHACDDVQPRVAISGLSGGGPQYSFSVDVTLGTFGTSKPGIGSATLQVYLDDQLVSTQNIPDSGSYDIGPIAAPSSGSHNFKAVVTDTGLYQGTDEQTVNVTTGSSSGFSGITPASGSTSSSGPVTFSWTAASVGGVYRLFIDGTQRTSTSKTTITFPVLTNTTHSWYVLAADGTQTAPITFTTQ
jgi:membrane peptidoglycan carboxypeptidase